MMEESLSQANGEVKAGEVHLEGPRPARLEEREELLAMINSVFRIDAGRQPTIASDWAHVYAPHNLANISVMRDAGTGKLVASTGVWVCDVVMGAATLRVGGINCVGTLPDYRRHGLGSRVMMAAQERMRELGCQVALLGTGIMNWYRRLGWEEAGLWRSYRLNRGNVGLLPPLRPGLKLRVVELTPYQPEAGTWWQGGLPEALLALYRQARMGAPRSAAEFRQRLAARSFSRIFVAEEAGTEGRVAAYLLLHPYGVLEWAGRAEDVAALARAAFEALDDPQASTSRRASEPGSAFLRTLSLQTPGWSQPLTELLDRLRIPFESQYLGMLYVIDPQAIVTAYGLAGVEITPLAGDGPEDELENRRYRVRVGPSETTLDRRQLTKLLFGPERVSDVGSDLFPLPLCQWFLEQV
jgi:predicted acetyltransferase